MSYNDSDTNIVKLVLILIVVLGLPACMMVGDVYLSRMIFNATSQTCQDSADSKAASQYSLCCDLTDIQLGFARFKMVMFWILFTLISISACATIYFINKRNPVVFTILMLIAVSMCVVILIGGIFMTQYVFNGGNKSCQTQAGTQTPQYCYNMNEMELNLARISVAFGWIYTIISAVACFGFAGYASQRTT